MLRVFFAEWRKLRRPTLFLGTYGAALGFTALICSFLYLMIDSESGNGDRGQSVGADAAAAACARPKPMPLAAPVITATLSLNTFMLHLLSLHDVAFE
jgi:hypothetical protein